MWKTLTVALAAFLTGLVLAGVPFVLRAASEEQVDQIEARAVVLLERQATLAAQVSFLQEQVSQVMDALEQLERLLRDADLGVPPP